MRFIDLRGKLVEYQNKDHGSNECHKERPNSERATLTRQAGGAIVVIVRKAGEATLASVVAGTFAKWPQLTAQPDALQSALLQDTAKRL